ncbi:MAG TPA: YoaK family protein [Lachnospiraceae bacterium]|nr:YoaK family protein [Lachnospiraceae bacterium]
MSTRKQMSDTYLIGAILAVIGGYLDAYTYISRGHVFANAQTGNIVLLGIEFADRNYTHALSYLVPIISFSIGILVVEAIRNRFKQNMVIHWRQIILTMECIALFAVGFMPLGNYDTLANVIVSFVCSLQVQSFRKMNGNAYATTMCTGNLRSATEQLYLYRISKDRKALSNSLQYFGIIAMFIIGAGIGAMVTNQLQEKSVLVCCAGLIVTILLMFNRRRES